jgi:hypothetical protein
MFLCGVMMQEELISLVPHVNEANAISEELDKKRFFEIVLVLSCSCSHNSRERHIAFFCVMNHIKHLVLISIIIIIIIIIIKPYIRSQYPLSLFSC